MSIRDLISITGKTDRPATFNLELVKLVSTICLRIVQLFSGPQGLSIGPAYS